MIENLIEDWLTKANERGYELPFCQVLATRGYDVLHMSSHGPGEHGKDIIARAPSSRLETFQLKGGDIRLSTWRKMRGEVEDLVRLPAVYPGIDPNEPHFPFLVTNGALLGDARENMDRYARTWSEAGANRLEVLPGTKLKRWFVEAHGRYLTPPLPDFKSFVSLYAGDFRDRLPRREFTDLLISLCAPERLGRGEREAVRAIASMTLTASYVIEQYERVENHLAAMEGWTIVRAAIMHVVEREGLQSDGWRTSARIAWEAFVRSAEAFEKEAWCAETYAQPHRVIAEPRVHGVRVLLILGWVAALQVLWRTLGRPTRALRDGRALLQGRFKHVRITTEADWPFVFFLSKYMTRLWRASEGEHLLSEWLRNLAKGNAPEAAHGVPSPYWLPERVIELHAGLLPSHERESFSGRTYTALQALDMMVRRLRRQEVSVLWPKVSRLDFCDFRPGDATEWFRWRARTGTTVTIERGQPASWSRWREEVDQQQGEDLPEVLREAKQWTVPFALVFPHRVNRAFTNWLDQNT